MKKNTSDRYASHWPSLIAVIMISFIATGAFAADDRSATKQEATCEEFFRTTGSLFVPANLAGREGFAVLSTTSNMVAVHCKEKSLAFDGARVVTHRNGIPYFSGDDRSVYENLPVSCLGLPQSPVLGVCFDLTMPDDVLGPPLVGVIGTSFLRLHAFRMNLSVPMVRVLQSPVENPAGKPIPILWEKDIPLAPVRFPVLGSRQLVLDLSFGGLQLSEERIASLKRMGHIVPQKTAAPFSHVDLSTGKKTDRTQTTYILRWLEIGGMRFVNVPCQEAQHNDHGEAIGLDLLQYLDLTIDFPKNTLWVSSANGSNQIQVPTCDYGVFAEKTDAGEREITFIDPGSPASKSQIQTGDVVFEIDGKPIRDMSEKQIIEKFFRAEETATIGIRRSGKIVHLQLLVEHDPTFPPQWSAETPEFNPE